MQPPHRYASDHQLVRSPQSNRKGRGIEIDERTLGLGKAADEEQAADFEIPRMRGVDTVAVLLERCPRRVERLRRPAKIARGERDFGLGDDASRARDGLVRTKGPRRASQQRLRSYQIAELCHRDAAQRQRRWIVTQRDPFECAERITRGERTRRGRDYRVHRNPATLVTPTVRFPPTRLSQDHESVGRRAWRRPREGANNAEYQKRRENIK